MVLRKVLRKVLSRAERLRGGHRDGATTKGTVPGWLWPREVSNKFKKLGQHAACGQRGHFGIWEFMRIYMNLRESRHWNWRWNAHSKSLQGATETASGGESRGKSRRIST